jgi:hypothetical protein
VSDHEPTCGQGLAAGAELPEQIGTLIQAMADVLQDHTRSLRQADANAQLEREGYERVVAQLRTTASGLAAVASTMRRCHDLPMGDHDESTLADQQSLRIFESLVRAEEALLASLQAIASEHRGKLGHHSG